jgi:hypothetical protein
MVGKDTKELKSPHTEMIVCRLQAGLFNPFLHYQPMVIHGIADLLRCTLCRQ